MKTRTLQIDGATVTFWIFDPADDPESSPLARAVLLARAPGWFGVVERPAKYGLDGYNPQVLEGLFRAAIRH